MDSYSFHFERMSNVDLHPLSLPVSRLSPAKSSSSIVDQLAAHHHQRHNHHHHQHGKGDSAYSSFSGGSTVAPDYQPSPLFLPDDFSHYADLKYVKSIYHPAQVLQSDAAKTMDQLYRSVEAISQHYRNNNATAANANADHNSVNNGFHTNNNKALSKPAPHPPPPPPPPARMDSFIATKNLENSSRVHHHHHHHGSEFQQPRPTHYNDRVHAAPNARSPEKPNPDDSNFNSDPVYSVWRGGAQQQQQQLPVYRSHLQSQDQTRAANPEYLFITDNKSTAAAPVLIEKPRQLSTGGGCNGDVKSNGSSGHFESQKKKKRAHSAHDWSQGSEPLPPPPPPQRAASPWNGGPSFINSSVTHKGQFYFVTGVCNKTSDHGMRTYSASECGGSEGSTAAAMEKNRIREKERSHSTMENLFRPLQDSPRFASGTILDESDVFISNKDARSHDQENHRPSLVSALSSRSLDTLEEIDFIQSRDIGRHSANNPIFYCGPDRSCSPPLTPTPSPTQTTEEQPSKRGKRQPLGDVASERINKETTPLLYHLTEANRAAMQPKKDADVGAKGREAVLNKTGHGDAAKVKDGERRASSRERVDDVSVACNTLDDSFKKYYKEKLKDAQSKVLRETSFKRKDLQLSWPHRVRQKPELRPTAVHAFSPSQDSETSTDTLTPSVATEETERRSIKEEVEVEVNPREVDPETEKENGRPANQAQPQAAAAATRIGGRRRLTPEQKKMCYSEPEKLNQLGGGTTPSSFHSACRSFGNEFENVFAAECEREREQQQQQGEQGLVAARRKMFETRGRALSASSASKTNLKHLQHKALVEYMERKTGQKVAEPQQPAAQAQLPPPPPRQRHSLGEKPFDWGPRPLSANHDGRNTKKKPHRPHSAGRILDSSSSSIRYAQFFSAQSCSGQYAGQLGQPRWRESHGPSQGKSASVESLLDQPEPPSFFRSRSTSTPHAFEANDYEDELPVDPMETCSAQPDVSVADPVPVGHQQQPAPQQPAPQQPAPQQQPQVRVVAQRGKSMEELGASKLTRLSAMSKSSEQLDQLRRRSNGPGPAERDKRSGVSFMAEVREAQGQERARRKDSQGQTQNQTQKKLLLKQNSEPGENVTEAARSSSRSTSPTSCSSSSSSSRAARLQSSGSPGSHGPFTEEFRSSRLSSETSSNPTSPRGVESSEREAKSSSPTQTKPPGENRSCLSQNFSSPVPGPDREQSVDEPSGDVLTPDLNQEVSLSRGVTTDPSLWILPPDEAEIKELVHNPPLTDGGADDPSTCSARPQTQTSEASVSPSTTESDVTQQEEEEEEEEEEEKNLHAEEEEQETEERGAPEGETETQPAGADRPEWEELVKAAVQADQSLARVLYPLANRKTALMLMEQLLSEDTLLMEEHYKKKQEQSGAAESAEPDKAAEASPCVVPAADDLRPQSSELQSTTDVAEKKRLLASYIEERLRSLEETRGALQAEIKENVARGEALEELVRERCLPVELERYNLFIGDLERVVSLLLHLSARLARVQNALSTVDQNTDAEEKESLDSRHRLLCKQREDAKDLKDNLDRRENLVSTFLSRQLSAEQLQDYRRFVQTKASLLIRQKDLEERQRLGEEQLEALTAGLGP